MWTSKSGKFCPPLSSPSSSFYSRKGGDIVDVYCFLDNVLISYGTLGCFLIWEHCLVLPKIMLLCTYMLVQQAGAPLNYGQTLAIVNVVASVNAK